MISIIQRSAIALTLLTSMGVLVHDTKIDQAIKTAASLPSAFANFDTDRSFKFGNSDHTHVERVSFSQGMNIAAGGTPRMGPRDDHKKYHMTQRVGKGFHGFDGYYLPETHAAES
jgi:hypothetical protein